MDSFDFELIPIYFHNIKKKVDKSLNRDLKKYGINCIHFRPIVLLARNKEGLSLYQLTKIIGIDKANVTRVINDLVKKNIVYKTDDKQRGYKIKLTEQGSELADHMYEHRKKLNQKIFQHFSEEEKKQLFLLIKKYFENMIYLEEE